MGATSWRYYTAYDRDPNTALQRLRADVFARGEYVDLTGSQEDALRNTKKRFGIDPDSQEARRDIERSLQMQLAVDHGRKEDLRGLDAEERSFVKRMRWVMRLARLFGAAPPKRKRRRPRSIEELLERAEESGTHSILDIEGIGTRRGFGSAAPMPEQTLQQVFGTGQPTHEQVEQRWPEVAEMLGRWQAYYLTVFRDGRPDEYAFIGCSGD